jgi:ubiquinone/menaquinone biosynthesis C-methylase UbiE
MRSAPLVTVVMPVRDGGRYVVDALASVLVQSLSARAGRVPCPPGCVADRAMSERETLAEVWEHEARAWADWAAAPGHDHYYWRFDRPALLALLPPPRRRTLDLGCGDGRLERELAALGHDVVGVDGSPTVTRIARARGSALFVRADAAHLPFPSGSFDLVVANLSLQDMDDPEAAAGGRRER